MSTSSSSSAIYTLNDVNRSLIPALVRQGEPYIASKLAACRHGPKPSWCGSGCCTICSRKNRIQHLRTAQLQITSALNLHPGSVPLAVTLTTSDCQPDELQERTKAISHGFKSLFKPDGRKRPLLDRKCIVAAGWIDLAPSEVEPELYNCHWHGLLVMDTGWPFTGRDRVRQDDSFSHWKEWWRTAAGSSARSVKVEIPRSLDASLSYSFKTAFSVVDTDGAVHQAQYLNPVNNQLLQPERILYQQDQLSGLNRVLKHKWLN